jgi:hypothetical protein
MAKEYAVEMLETLAEIARNGESEAARVTAANALLDRAYGRPRQAVELTGENGGAIEITRIERAIIDPQQGDAADRHAARVPTAH